MVLGWIWSSLFREQPALNEAAELGSPKAAVATDAPVAIASPKTASKAPKTDATLANKGATPGTGRARREAKRQQLEAEHAHVANFCVSLEVLSDGKTRAVYAHRLCRPGDVDAWVGLHEVLDDAETAGGAEADDIRYEVAGRALSGRYRYKGIRSTKLEGDIAFPLSAEKLSDGEYVLALHNNGGATGDENLFLAVSESFMVSNGELSRERKRQKK